MTYTGEITNYLSVPFLPAPSTPTFIPLRPLFLKYSAVTFLDVERGKLIVARHLV